MPNARPGNRPRVRHRNADFACFIGYFKVFWKPSARAGTRLRWAVITVDAVRGQPQKPSFPNGFQRFRTVTHSLPGGVPNARPRNRPRARHRNADFACFHKPFTRFSEKVTKLIWDDFRPRSLEGGVFFIVSHKALFKNFGYG